MAVTIVALIAGFIAGVVSYPYLDVYLLGLFAFIGAVAVGIIVYLIVLRLLAELVN